MSDLRQAEEAIAKLVRRFYELGRQDGLLGPVFDSAIADFEAHFVVVQDFWSHALLGTGRYKGHPFPVHRALAVEPEHFDRWLEVFRQAAEEALPPLLAQQAVARAVHMTQSFKVGLFPWKTADGKMTRHMPRP